MLKYVLHMPALVLVKMAHLINRSKDVAIMRSLPNMRVYVPCDQYETKAIIKHVANTYGPCYVRLGREKSRRCL